jgi:peptide/nickel transport system permease protein
VLTYIVRRLLNLLPTFLGATLLAFVISQLVPGDFLNTMRMSPDVRPETIERLERQYGLDQPWFVQYTRWMGSLVRGDLGLSFDSNQPVVNLVRRPVQNSMILVVLSIILLWVFAIPLGVYAATRQYSLGDQAVGVVSYFGLAIPNFFFALLIILFLFNLRGFTRDVFGYNELLLPVAKMTSNEFSDLSPLGQVLDILRHAIIPAFVTATAGMAGFTRVLRAQMIEFLSSDFIRTARAKGLGERSVTYKHALRPALIPFIAGIGGLLPALIGGVGLVEIVMAWPGITPVLLASISRQDIYVVLGFLVISTLLLMIGNLVSDLLLAVADPRIRYS